MAHFVAIMYEDEQQASKVIDALKKLEEDGTIDLDDAVAVTKDKLGGIKLDKILSHAAAGAALGAFWGAIVGAIFFLPAVGAAFGTVSGALAGKFIGLTRADDFGDFGLNVQQHMPPGSSAVLMLVRKNDPERAIDELKQYGGEVMLTTLPDDVEAHLRLALDELVPAK